MTSITYNAFSSCSGLTEVTIPGSVTSIGNYAFEGCSGLEKITVEDGNPNYDSRENCNAIIDKRWSFTIELISGCKNTIIPGSVTSIGFAAFKGCSGLTELTIPGSVTSIGNNTFKGCTGLTELTIPGSVTSIGNSAFSSCSALTSVTIPNSVTSISNSTFEYCSGLTSVTIPNSVTSIGGRAFYECSGLTELTIGNGVTSIGDYAFSRCTSLEKITVESGNPKYDSRENCNAIIETAKNEVFLGCKNTIIPNSVTSIGQSAFQNCTSLTKLTIPSSVTSIGYSAFEGCSGLTELTIGNGVTSIGDNAFSFCSSLTTLYSLNTTPPSVESWTFSNVYPNHYATVDVFVPAEALAAYQTADVWKEFQKLQGFDATAVEKVSAAEQIHSANGQVTVTGLTDGTTVAVYDLSGRQVGTATSKGGQVNISTGMTAGAAAIVKVGDKSVKTVMK